MGFSTNNKRKGPMADINVTPLVDVMLVLLVIFMITAPLLLNGINLELPKTKEVNRINLTTTQIVISLTNAGELYLGKDKILKEELINEVKNLFTANNTKLVYLRADYAISYGKVAKLMSFLKANGVSDIALVTEIEEQK